MLIIMITQLDFKQVWDGLQHAGYWFFAVVALWAFLYIFNTATWYIIIRSGSDEKPKINFWWLYKITVSGFALNYATPGGLMGGEPYRVMSLSPKIGTERASSSVILYAMTHIFSHFLFWLLSILLFLLTEKANFVTGIVLALSGAFCILGVWFFIKGYQKGMAVRIMNLIKHIPGIKKRSRNFIDKHKEQLDTIDRQIAALHRQNKKSFVSAVMLELVCRFLSAFEILLYCASSHLMSALPHACLSWPSQVFSPTCCSSFPFSSAAVRVASSCPPPASPCLPAPASS